jgi:NADH-quinone oxidoreductase subunit M
VNGFPWLTTLGVLPLLGAVVLAALPKGRDLLAKQIALGVSLAVFAVTLVMATRFKSGGPQFQFAEHHPWISSFGVSYSVGVDGIALVLIAMATILVPIVILAGWHEADESSAPTKNFFALILVLETMIIGVFAATDVFLFYVFFEAMLIPVYFLIGSFGGAQRSYAAVKFLLYSLFGGLLMLAALIALYVVSSHQLGTGTFDYTRLVGLHINATTEKWLFLGFFAAFAIKAPLWPFHTWLPDAAAESTPGTAVLLVGVLDKVGTFGMIRLCLPLFPNASKYFTPLILVLAVVGILYGALVAIGQTDMMRLVAYTSLSHFGFITLGIFAMTSQGQSGSTLYMVNHGFSTAGLFIVAGFLVSRRGSRLIADYGGVQRVAPLLAGSFLVMGLASLALPGLSSFVSEFLVLVGTYTRYPVYAVLATLGIVLAAIYVLLWYQRVATGPATEKVKGFRDLGGREMLAIAPLVALIIGIGFFPKPLLDVINPAVSRTLHQVGRTDPVPTINQGLGGPATASKGTAK